MNSKTDLSEVEKNGPQNNSEESARKHPLNLDPHPFWDFWGPVLMTVMVYLGIRNYIAEARYIPSGSMLPGLQINDCLLIEKLSYRRRSPKRGEIVVFNSPYSFDPLLRSSERSMQIKCALINFPPIALITGIGDRACDAYIKRVVAVAGDYVSVNSRGGLSINGTVFKEPYVTNYCLRNKASHEKCRSFNGNVPSGHVLVLGDNRRNSWDGRYWPGKSFLPEEEIIGRAFFRFWPINRIRLINF